MVNTHYKATPPSANKHNVSVQISCELEKPSKSILVKIELDPYLDLILDIPIQLIKLKCVKLFPAGSSSTGRTWNGETYVWKNMGTVFLLFSQHLHSKDLLGFPDYRRYQVAIQPYSICLPPDSGVYLQAKRLRTRIYTFNLSTHVCIHQLLQ